MPILLIRFGISIVFGCSTEYFKLVHNLFGKLRAKTVQSFFRNRDGMDKKQRNIRKMRYDQQTI